MITKEMIKEYLENFTSVKNFSIKKTRRGDGFFLYNNLYRWGHGYFIEAKLPLEHFAPTLDMFLHDIKSELLQEVK